MIKIFLPLIILMFAGMGRAEIRMKLEFPVDQVKQGSLQEAVLHIDLSTAQNFEIQRLKGIRAGETLYFHKLSPLLRSQSNDTLTSDVSVIFLKVPESNILQFKLDDKEVYIQWADVQVLPTKAAKGFIFEDFSIPARKKILLWVILALALICLSVFGFFINKKLKLKRFEKKRRHKLKEDILSVQTYEEVVQVWQNKLFYIKEFPQIELAIKSLEKILFKYVFKPSPTEQDKSEVLKAYRNFVSEIQEGLNGI